MIEAWLSSSEKIDVAGPRQRGEHADVGEVAGAEQQRASRPLNAARRSSSRRWIVIVPDTSREAPAPTPQRIAASAAASRTRG